VIRASLTPFQEEEFQPPQPVPENYKPPRPTRVKLILDALAHSKCGWGPAISATTQALTY